MTLVYPWLPASYSLTRTYSLSSSVVRSRAGIEVRRSWQSRPLLKFILQYNTLTDQERQRLIAFWMYHNGSITPFWFHDWSESKLLNQRLGTGDWVNKRFLIKRTYGESTDPFVTTETIVNLFPPLPYLGYGENGYGGYGYGGTGWIDYDMSAYEPVAYVNGVAVDAKWEFYNGVPSVLFETPPANQAIITADFAVSRLVRFDPELSTELFNVRLNRGRIDLQEVIL